MNGSRHAQSFTAGSGSTVVMVTPATAAMRLHTPMDSCSHAAYRARRSDGACSTRKAAAPPVSPPAENPLQETGDKEQDRCRDPDVHGGRGASTGVLAPMVPMESVSAA
ncbi:hypothetical protein [Streptomyces sp. NPDC088246]|uniref:hypothetical protein n=1 Tax=Streptomyces sp. NPDC088246 TaxID=3365842 RepID=UPI0038258CF7